MLPFNHQSALRCILRNDRSWDPSIRNTQYAGTYAYMASPTTVYITSETYAHALHLHYTAHVRIWKPSLRETKIQTFQYRILHRIIPCNKWLHNIKIKDSDSSDYYGGVDDILHFFKKCPKVNDFGHVGLITINWWENLSEITIKNSPALEECIIHLIQMPASLEFLYALY